MFDYDFNGMRWGITFLTTDTALPDYERMRLLAESTSMYLDEEGERDVSSEHYEGRLYTRREHGMIGQFGGMIFYAELDTTHGKSKLSFIVNERTHGRDIVSRN